MESAQISRSTVQIKSEETNTILPTPLFPFRIRILYTHHNSITSHTSPLKVEVRCVSETSALFHTSTECNSPRMELELMST
jgi:hypothetical protein